MTIEETKKTLTDYTKETHVERIERLLSELKAMELGDTEGRQIKADEIQAENILQSAIHNSVNAQIQEKQLARLDDDTKRHQAYLDETKHVQAFRDVMETRYGQLVKALENIADHLGTRL